MSSAELGDQPAKDPARKTKKRRRVVSVREKIEYLHELFDVPLLTGKVGHDLIRYEQRAWEWGRVKETKNIETEMIYDPTHPHAGVTGYLPPQNTKLKPGENQPGMSSAANPRGAISRILAREPDKDGIGKVSSKIATAIIEAAIQGDFKKVRALAEIINQVQGKPKEHLEHSVGTSVVANFVDPSKPELP